MFEWASHVLSGRRTYPRVSLPLCQRGEHYLIMLTSGIGRVEAQGAFPWTWHTIFVLQLLGSPSIGRVGRLLAIVNLIPWSFANFFPLCRAGLTVCLDLSSPDRLSKVPKTIQLKWGLQLSSLVSWMISGRGKMAIDLRRNNIIAEKKMRFRVSIGKGFVIPVIYYSRK